MEWCKESPTPTLNKHFAFYLGQNDQSDVEDNHDHFEYRTKNIGNKHEAYNLLQLNMQSEN